MRNFRHRTRHFVSLIYFVSALALFPYEHAFAEVPARFYWKTLSGTNAIPVIGMSVDGNSNPLDPSHRVSPNVDIDGEIVIAGYAKTFSIADRAAMAALLWPVGRLSSDVVTAGLTTRESSSGFGDPLIELDINLIGPKAIKNLPDLQRYEPGFSLDLIADLAIPIGEYDSSQSLNLGQNRWYGRVGAPIVWQLGSWVPGRRTTLELLPAVWFFGNNDDFKGQTLETEPSFELDAHLTRDFTANLWGSLDAVYFKGGKSKVGGVSSSSVSAAQVGFTLGYAISDGLQLTFGYKSTVNDSGPSDLRLNTFMFSLVAGWHPLLEGVRRLTDGH